MRALVRSATLNGYVGLARSFDLDPASLMRSVGLQPAEVAAPDKWVSAAAVARLLDVSAAECGDASFAIRLAEQRRLTTLGPLSVVLREEPDLRSALHLLMRYEHVYNEALRMRLDESDEIATIRLWFDFGEPVPGGQALALGVAALHGIIRECVGAHWRPLAVCLQGRAPADLTTLHKVFGPGLQFGHDFTGLIFYARDLDARNALSDPLMRPYAQRFLDSLVAPRISSSTDRVKEIVELMLPLGKCSVDQVARTLDMDRRTLHRHLAREGESFSSIVSSTREGLAQRHLANERYSMTDVAHLLGFAAPSAFSRWFQQQFGVSPSEWRATSTSVSEAETR
jgi:AraC-like DNA-binding protein